MFDKRQLIAVAGALLVAGGGAMAQTDSILGIATVTTYSADARIVAVDPVARTATFAFANGTVTTSKVNSSFAGFNARKVGDTVSVAFEDRLTLVLPGPDAGNGGGAGAATDTWWLAHWYVVGVDAAAGKISVVHPIGGQVRVYDVTTADGRKQLPRVKAGDYLSAMDPRVRVVAITP